MPKVSIVLPVYNGEKYLRDAVESILHQSFEDWELIVVNDCSTDSSEEIIAEYVKKDDRIKLITNETNKKLPASLNVGFRHVNGKYYTWTSDDNIYEYNAIERMVEYLDTHNEMLVCCGMKTIDENNVIGDRWIKYSNEFMYFNNCVGACFMYRKSVVDAIGEYNTDMFLVEDYEYWLRILFNYGDIGYIDETLYLYRVHNESLSSTRKYEIQKQLLRLRSKYIDDILYHNIYSFKNITKLYLDYLFDDSDEFNELYNKFYKIYPELKKLKIYNNETHLIAYGAGQIGNSAYRVLKDKIDIYMDKNYEKTDHLMNDRSIININQLLDNIDGRNVLITMSNGKIYDAINDLSKYKLKKILVCDWNTCL